MNVVTKNIAGAASNVIEISSSARQVKTSSGDLAKVAAQLQEIVGRFNIDKVA